MEHTILTQRAADELADSPELLAALSAQPHTLPRVNGLEPFMLARWLYRMQLMDAPAWFAMVCVAGTVVNGGHRCLDATDQAGGGWLVLASEISPDDRVALSRAAQRRRVEVLTESSSRTVRASPLWVRRVRKGDELHHLATDPSLTSTRRALLAHAMAGSALLLTGEPGTGLVELAKWAHQVAGVGELARLGPDRTGQVSPSSWLLVDELADLDEEQRAQLQLRVRATEDLPPLVVDTRGRPNHPAFRPLSGRSPALGQVLQQALRAAPTAHPVLVLGESGTGKELLARAVHDASGRTGDFVAVDLSAIPEDLVESELFGHIKGAFTGAERDRAGAFRSADGGTLFIDELGNVRPSVQARLLRVLQERRVRPVGSDTSVGVNVRVVAATNADLDAMVAAGTFREDLAMRLNTFVLRLPPLRHRPEDVVFLAGQFFAAERGVPAPPPGWLTADGRAGLSAWWWPGNVRELENVVRRAAANVDPGVPLTLENLGLVKPGAGRAPVISTHSSTGTESAWGLARGVAHTLTAVTLRVPPLRSRDPGHRRALVRAMMRGRCVSTDALDLLATQPWWGNLTELEQALAALDATPPGPIDADRVRRTLPNLMGVSGHRPIRILVSPYLDSEGRLRGLRDRFDTASVVIGRVRDGNEFQTLLRKDPQRWGWLRAHAVGSPGCLALPMVDRLSRVQAVVIRGEGGLSVVASGEGALPCRAGPLTLMSGRLSRVGRDPVRLGRAGELRVFDRSGDELLHLFVFEGTVAWDELGPIAAGRLRSKVPVPTAATDDGRPAVHKGVNDRDRWVLNPDEAQHLVSLLVTFPGGRFTTWMRRELGAPRADGPTARLATYLQTAPNMGDYCGRLLEYSGNEGVVVALRSALPAGQSQRLPARVSRLVGDR